MSLAGAAKSVIALLESAYKARHNGLDGLSFEVIGPHAMAEDIADRVTIFVYRVEQDPTRRVEEVAPSERLGARRTRLVVDLRFLLIVWMSDPLRELQILQECMEVLELNPMLAGGLLDTKYANWEPAATLRISMDHMPADESLRLWDALIPSFRLAVPYVIRTIRIALSEQVDGPPVQTSTRIYVPAVPGETV